MMNRELIAMCLDLWLVMVMQISKFAKIYHAMKGTRSAYVEFYGNAKEQYERRICIGGNGVDHASLPVQEQHVNSTVSTISDEGLNAWELFLGKNLSMDEPARTDSENLSEEELKVRAEKEFDTIIPEWIKYARSIDWLHEYKDELKDSLAAGEEVDAVDHLLPLNIGKLYINAHESNKYGYLPLMASSSK